MNISGKIFLVFVFLSLHNLSAEDVNVSVREMIKVQGVRLKRRIPPANFFVGKVESAAAVDVSFQNSGKVVYIAPIGTPAHGLLGGEGNKTLIPGGVLAVQDKDLFESKFKSSKATLKGLQAHLEEAKTSWQRCENLSKKKIISKKDCDKSKRDFIFSEAKVKSAEANLFSSKYNLDACTLRAPFTGEVTKIYAADGDWVNKGESILRFELLSLVLINVDLPSELANLVDYDKKFLIYPQKKEKPFGAWLYESNVKKASVKLMVKNLKYPISNIPDNLKHLPQLKKIFFASKMLYDDTKELVALLPSIKEKVPLWVPLDSVKKDQKGHFVWRIKGEQEFKAYNPVSKVFKVEKVRVKPGNLYKDVPLGRFCVLEDCGKLKMYDIIAVSIQGDVKDGSDVVLAVEQWAFTPGEKIRVNIPELTEKGFYIPDYAVFHLTSDRHYVFILENKTVKPILVEILGGCVGELRIGSPQLKEGTVVLVKGITGTTLSGSKVSDFHLINQ